MKAVVIGCGVIGVTTAYLLRQRGHDVLVLERREGAGLETSFANGALLTPSMPEPWNTPGCWRVLLASLGRSDAALQLRWGAIPSLGRWGVAFLRNSGRERFRQNTLNNVRLALYSLEAMKALREETGIEYARTARGSLKIFRDRATLDRAVAAAQHLAVEGLSFRALSRQETVDLEPALAPIETQLAGAIHYEKDETGDAYRFCVGLAERARAQGVEFRFGAAVSSLEAGAREIKAIRVGQERIVADCYIVAGGSYSAPLLEPIGLRIPVRPAKGYSVTLERSPVEPSLSVPVVDDDFHAAIVPFGEGLRVAGTAEFAGYDLALRPERMRNLLKLLQHVLPGVRVDPAAVRAWCGLRPMSCDGVPIIGGTKLRNLFVSTGHGHLGWTMAAGSAQLLVDLICGTVPGIEPEPYSARRFYGSRQTGV